MLNKLLRLIATSGAMCFSLCAVAQQPVVSLTRSVATGNDDVEEYVPGGSGYTVGQMYLNSSDLELMTDGSKFQQIGVRFTNITVPQGAIIQHAYIQFTTDGGKNPVFGDIIIKGHDADNSPTFTSTAFNLTSRPVTTDSVLWAGSTSTTWGTAAGGTQGPNQKTPDLKDIVQTITDRSGWAAGNALTFVFKGTGVRNSVSYEGNSSQAPYLIVSYTTPPNNAFEFNGSTSILRKSNFGNPSGDFSIEAWAKRTTGGSGTEDIISTHENPGTRSGYFIEYNVGSDALVAGIAGSNNSWITATQASADWQVGKWHHVVMTYNAASKTIVLYVDGVQKATSSFGGSVTPVFSTRPFAIGGSDNYTGNGFNGAIDEVYFWNRLLTATEVDSSAHIARMTNTTGLKAYYSLDAYDTTIVDNSGNGYDATPTALSAASVIPSGAAMTFAPQPSVYRYKANWPAKNQSDNKGLSIGSSYSTETEFLLNGVSADTGITNSGIPSQLARRLNRTWALSKYGNTGAMVDTLRFSLLNNGITPINTGEMYLLTSTDGASFSLFSNDTGVVNNGVVRFLIPDTLNQIVTLGFTQIPGSETPLVSAGSVWKYLDNGSNQDTAWRYAGFNDTSWASGNAELGYGDNDEATVLSYGPQSSNKYVTYYFRKHFQVNTLTGYNSVRIRLKRDDGAIVYINGVEVRRDNMPGGTIDYTTYAASALSGSDESTFFETLIPVSMLDTGDNVIAVELHQSDASSSDISFDLELLKDQAVIPPASLIRGPYLNAGTPNSMVIRWRTDYSASSQVHYGTSANNLNLTAQNTTLTTEHEIKLTGLSPYTTYYYSIGSTTDTLQGTADNYFRTLINSGTDTALLRIGVIGDCGNNSTNQVNVRNQLINYLGSNYMDAWILLGDNAYSSGTDAEYQAEFFNIYKDKFLKQNPLFPAPGNHDYGNSSSSPTVTNHALAPYYQNFTMPIAGEAGGLASNNQAFYSYNVGNIHFLSLDSYGKEADATKLYDTTGAQVQWIKADLAANANKDWVVAYWHHPPYTMGSHNSDSESDLVQIRQKLLRILERNGVDLILCGHSHDYERSRLMQGHYGTENTFDATTHNLSQSSALYDGSNNSCPYVKDSVSNYNGTVYVVSGSAGQLGGSQAGYPHNALAAYSNATNGGSMILEVKGNRLDAKWVCADGVIRDKFTIMKDANVVRTFTINEGDSINLTAAYNGNYNWANSTVSTRNRTVSPIDTTLYVVQDDYNCVVDSFLVNVIPSTPLSVNWNYFKGFAAAHTNLLEWETAQEVNASNFVIERATDGSSYTAIGTVKAAGKPEVYHYEDAKLVAGTALYYYRLRQTDVDGGFRYSSVVSIRRDVATSGFDVQVAPNPSAFNKMQISTPGATTSAHITVSDASGRIVVDKDIQLQQAPQSFLPELKAGLYILSVVSEGGTVNRKLVIE